ncbi:MAG: hypothetical protein V4443_04970 [Pseudomonadota bacterium]
MNDDDYQTIWQLAHGWAGEDRYTSDSNNLSPEVKKWIYRVIVAIRNKILSVRTSNQVILDDDSVLGIISNFSHLRKFTACVTKNRFDKDYLDSLYVWRPEVLRWCFNDRLPIPLAWQEIAAPDTIEVKTQDSHSYRHSSSLTFQDQIGQNSIEEETQDKHWYKNLSDRRKQIAGCLHIAARLWRDNPTLSYEQVWNHDDMKKFDKPRIFPSLDSFREWARDIAPLSAKSPGRRKNSL